MKRVFAAPTVGLITSEDGRKAMAQQTCETRRSTDGPAYEQWMESQNLPIYRGHFIADPMALELAWLAERECNDCFVNLRPCKA